ncbi:MAG: LL-diaminopimelate aminotransferase [Lachnospiraceae bacterium]|nr:LL-diaminopimelate aminotransferase [Lachnospiraceae bacterium]
MGIHINEHYNELNESYLFAEIARKVAEYQKANPDKKLLKMGIGDVTRPLARCVTDAMKKASDEMGTAEGFHGYGPEQGYAFLREAIQNYYKKFGVELDADEIFISDGAKSDCGNFPDILSTDCTVLIPDPVYPVYADTNVMAGRKIIYSSANEENHFLPMPDESKVGDIIYICSPNNPTGACYSREQLAAWVAFAKKHNSLILFDAAYECFVTGDLPHSIYEIEGAKDVAVELCSFSKKAGFTGTRCGYTVVPKRIVIDGAVLNKLWIRRQTTKFNGVAYIVERGAEAALTDEGEKEVSENINYYRENAKIMTDTMDELGIYYTGGKNSPYVWLKCPFGMKSWDFFDEMLTKAGIVGTPGAGFGTNGEGFFRLTAFSTRETTIEAMKRLKEYMQSR